MALTDAITAGLDIASAVADRPAGVTSGPFVVMWPDAPVRSPRTIGEPNATQTTTIVCHCVGLTEESARIAEAKLAAAIYALYGTTVDGRIVLYPEQLSSLPMVRDDDVSPPLYDLAVEWRLRTDPA